MERIFKYTFREEDMAKTANGVAGQIIKHCMKLKGHEYCHAKYIDNGITITGLDGSVREIYVNERLVPGEILTVKIADPRDAFVDKKVEPVEGDLDILYEDEDMIIVNKPAGLVVHPCHGHYYDTVSNIIAYYYEQQGLDIICRSIGRLDRETSGALLFAKNKVAAGRLSNMREIGTSGRTYHAIAEGWLENDSDTIDKPIEQVPGVKLLRRTCESPAGQNAVTHYRVLGRSKLGDIPVSLVEAKIDTGRTHQIRVHMQSLGHPLIGDTLYGDRDKAGGFERALLHAASLECLQPFTNNKISIKAPYPRDFEQAMTYFL